MTFYWRLKDVPELREVPKKDRREWWREAVSQSNTASGTWARFALLLVGIFGVGAIRSSLGYAGEILHFVGMFAGIMLATMINEYWLVQPRARSWLQSHLAHKHER
jgi:hypothetical protein